MSQFHPFRIVFQEIVDKPRLFVEGASANDVTQGQLGNCWYVAACATLAGVKELWHKVSFQSSSIQIRLYESAFDVFSNFGNYEVIFQLPFTELR